MKKMRPFRLWRQLAACCLTGLERQRKDSCRSRTRLRHDGYRQRVGRSIGQMGFCRADIHSAS